MITDKTHFNWQFVMNTVRSINSSKFTQCLVQLMGTPNSMAEVYMTIIMTVLSWQDLCTYWWRNDPDLAANLDMRDLIVDADGDDEVAGFAQTLPHQVAPVFTLVLQHFLCVLARDMAVKPSANRQLHALLYVVQPRHWMSLSQPPIVTNTSVQYGADIHKQHLDIAY